MKQLFVLITILFTVPCSTIAQSNRSLPQTSRPLTQTIRGTVTDKLSGSPIPGATILVDATRQGTTTDDRGQFTLSSVAIGRHTVSVSFIGYETALVKEILVTSAREIYLEIALTESTTELSEVVVRPEINKSASLNKMALLGAQTFSVEEAGRFAVGMDDMSFKAEPYFQSLYDVPVTPGATYSILNLKTIHDMLPRQLFLRINRSYLVNKDRIDSFSNNDVFIGKYEIAISSLYRDAFLEILMGPSSNSLGNNA